MTYSKDKGTACETALVNYCQALGYTSAERLALAGAGDRGDVRITPWLNAECKAYAVWSDALIDQWLLECDRESRAAGVPVILVVKRPRKSVLDWLVIWRNTHGQVVTYRLHEVIRTDGIHIYDRD